MSHNSLTHTDWTLAGVTAADLQSLELKIAQGIDGDNGGTWCPSSQITLNSSTYGLVCSGPCVVWGPMASVFLAPFALYPLSVFPALSSDHTGRNRKVVQGLTEGMTVPVFGSAFDPITMGLQAIAAATVDPIFGTVTPTRHVVPVFAHDGATLTSVTLHLIVPTPHAALPTTMPSVRLVVVSFNSGSVGVVSELPMTSVAAGADNVGNYQLPAPANGAAWYANGAPQAFKIPVDQNNVINNATGLIYAIITDEQGATGWWGQVPLTSVQVATTGPLASLSGLGTPIDGLGLSAQHRVLVKNQIDPAQNGVYVASSGAWSRALDSRTPAQLALGQLVYVSSGATNCNAVFQQQSPVQQVTGFPSWTGPTTYKLGDTVSPTIATPYTVGGFQSLPVGTAGSGYSKAPSTADGTIVVGGSWTTPPVIHANLLFYVASATLTSGGSGYTSTPTVSAVGGGGTSCVLTAVMGATSYGVASVTPTGGSSGSGYWVGDAGGFVPNGAWTLIGGFWVDGNGNFGTGLGGFFAPGTWAPIPTPAGTWHTNAPVPVTFTGGGTPTVQAQGLGVYGPSGAITNVLMDGPGTNHGAGYTSAPTPVFPPPAGGGVTASGASVLDTGSASVASINWSSSSNDFTDPPQIVISGGGGSGATAVAVMSGYVTDFVIDNPGDGFVLTSWPPVVTLSGTATAGTPVANAGHVITPPKPAPGLCFVCTAAGTSNGTQPLWPAAAGLSIVDGTVTWTAQPDPGALFSYGTPLPLGTIFVSMELNFTGIADTRWA